MDRRTVRVSRRAGRVGASQPRRLDRPGRPASDRARGCVSRGATRSSLHRQQLAQRSGLRCISADVALTVSSAHATASQSSEIEPLSVTGSAAVDATATGDTAYATGSSHFSLTFDLPDSSPYELDANLFAYSTVAGPLAITFLWLTDGTTNPVIVGGSASAEGAPLFFIDTSGVLPAGRYRLEADSQGGGMPYSTASMTFDFTFTVIPEPSTALLLAGGLAALAARRNPGARPKRV